MKSVEMCWKSNHHHYFHPQKMMAAAKVMNVAGVCDADASSCYASSSSSSSSSCVAYYFVYLPLVRLLPSSVLVGVAADFMVVFVVI